MREMPRRLFTSVWFMVLSSYVTLSLVIYLVVVAYIKPPFSVSNITLQTKQPVCIGEPVSFTLAWSVNRGNTVIDFTQAWFTWNESQNRWAAMDETYRKTTRLPYKDPVKGISVRTLQPPLKPGRYQWREAGTGPLSTASTYSIDVTVENCKYEPKR